MGKQWLLTILKQLNMNFDLKNFLKANKWPILLGASIYAMFLFLQFQETEFAIALPQKKTSSGPRTHGTVNRFYHK